MVKRSLKSSTHITSTRRVFGLGLLCLVSQVPIDGTALWQFAYGLTGQLSPTSWLLVLLWAIKPLRFTAMFQGFCKLPSLFLTCIGIGVFYFMSLNNHGPDPYAWGYQPFELIIFIASCMLVALPHSKGIAFLVSIDLVAYAGHLLQSDNLWDYLFDPILFIFLLLLLIRNSILETLRVLSALIFRESD